MLSTTLCLALAALGPPQGDGSAAAPAPAPTFTRRDLVVDGQPVRTLCGSPIKNYILEVNGSGVVLGDFDGSGSVDLVVVSGSTIERAEAGEPGDPSRLFLNDGAANFSAAPEPFALTPGRWGMGGTAGDLDNDGHLDLVVTNWGADQIFLNRGGAGFRDATEGGGLTGKRWGTSAALLDHDLDGTLDLVVVNYLSFRRDEISARESGECKWKGLPVMCGPEGLTAVHDQLYRGNGDGTFSDVTAAAGFRPENAGFGLGVTTLDYDGDGDTDVYVTNDSTPNFLWENQGDGTFAEVGFRRGVDLDSNGKEQAGMGIACGDVNEDGIPDLFVTNFSGENNALYQSRASKTGRAPRFSDRSHSAGVGGPSMQLLGWGTGMFDADLDGDLDLFVLNGHVYPQAGAPGTDTSYAQPDQLFVNTGSGVFEEHPLSAGPDLVSRGGAYADLDGDGDVDVIATQVEGAIQIHANTSANENGWIAFALDVEGGNRDGLGARIEITVGERRSVAEIRTSSGFQAAVPAVAHFGLGSAERVDSVVVRTPDGRTRRFEGLAGGQLHRLAVPAQTPKAGSSADDRSEGGR